MTYLGLPLGASYKATSIWNGGWLHGSGCICRRVVGRLFFKVLFSIGLDNVEDLSASDNTEVSELE
jgi:hypothetical protein